MKRDFPGGSDSKESASNRGDLGLTLGQEDPLQKGMATHSSILAWEIPRMEEPGGLQSMGSQRAGHSLATEHTHTHRVKRTLAEDSDCLGLNPSSVAFS